MTELLIILSVIAGVAAVIGLIAWVSEGAPGHDFLTREAKLRRMHNRLLLDRAESYVAAGLSVREAKEHAYHELQREARELLA